MNPNSIGILLATATALTWAVLAIGLKYTVQFTSAGNIVWIRMLVAFLLLSFIFLLKKRSYFRILRHPPRLGVLAALALAANYYGFMKGVEMTSASNAQIMIQMAPMSLILIGIFYFKEIPSPLQWAGFVCALMGFSFFFWDQARVTFENIDQFLIGNLWIIMAAITWALFATFQKLLTDKWSPQEINLLIYFVSTLVLLPVADIPSIGKIPDLPLAIIIVLGINTLIAYGALGEALKRIPASHVSLIVSMNPLLTLAILAVMRSNQVTWIKISPIDWRGYLGAFLVVTGVCLTVFKKSKPLRQPMSKA